MPGAALFVEDKRKERSSRKYKVNRGTRPGADSRAAPRTTA